MGSRVTGGVKAQSQVESERSHTQHKSHSSHILSVSSKPHEKLASHQWLATRKVMSMKLAHDTEDIPADKIYETDVDAQLTEPHHWLKAAAKVGILGLDV
jgi:hypothetical protein